MTVTALPVRDEYTASAGQTVFNYSFLIFTNQDLNVYVTPAGQDPNDSLDLTTAYTVDNGGIGNPAGGFIILNTGASSGDLVTIVSNIVDDRTVDYQNSGQFLPDTVNADFDRVVSLTKQQADKNGRTLSFPQSLQNASSLGLPVPVAGSYLAWNGSETALINVGAPGSILPSELNGTALDMIADASLSIGDYLITTGYRSKGDAGWNTYEIVAAGTGTHDGGKFIDLTGSGHQARGLFPGGVANVRQFGAAGNDSTDDSVALNAAFLAFQYVEIPIGNYRHSATLTIFNNRTIVGHDRTSSKLKYTGTGSALINTNAINSSGYGMVTLRNFTIEPTGVADTGLDWQSGGFSFYTMDLLRITGTFKYGMVLDGTEVSSVTNCIIENGTGILDAANIWIVNGPERRAGQLPGFTNGITVQDCQFNAAQYGIIDDGGTSHFFFNNNHNGHRISHRMAGVQGFAIDGGTFESPGIATPDIANIYFADTPVTGAINKGTCKNGRISNFVMTTNVTAGNSIVLFASSTGSAFHESVQIMHCLFGNVLGRVAAIDVTKLRNGYCGPNYENSASKQHFTGVHASAGILIPPNNTIDLEWSYNVDAKAIAFVSSQTVDSDTARWGATALNAGALGYKASGGNPTACVIKTLNNLPMIFNLGGADRFDIDTSGNATVQGYLEADHLRVLDAITAPAATAGSAKIYVDTADGDLKVIFGSGTIKTLATDP